MKNIEEFNVEPMNQEELVLTEGGQCDCESGGKAFAKAVKNWWNTSMTAFGKALSDGSWAATAAM